MGISRSIRPSWRGGAARVVCSSEGMQSVSTESGGHQAVKQAMFKDASHLIAVNPPRVSLFLF